MNRRALSTVTVYALENLILPMMQFFLQRHIMVSAPYTHTHNKIRHPENAYIYNTLQREDEDRGSNLGCKISR